MKQELLGRPCMGSIDDEHVSLSERLYLRLAGDQPLRRCATRPAHLLRRISLIKLDYVVTCLRDKHKRTVRRAGMRSY